MSDVTSPKEVVHPPVISLRENWPWSLFALALRAIPYEGAHAGPVSREVQQSAGLLTATVVYGLSLGGLFALAFAVAYGRVARATPRTTAYGLAAAAFLVVFLVPFLKYPASPPGAADPEDHRTARTLAYGNAGARCSIASS